MQGSFPLFIGLCLHCGQCHLCLTCLVRCAQRLHTGSSGSSLPHSVHQVYKCAYVLTCIIGGQTLGFRTLPSFQHSIRGSNFTPELWTLSSGSLCLNFKWSINECYVFKSVLFYYLLAPIAKVLKVDILNIFWNPKFMKKRNKQDGNGMIFHQKVNVWKMSFF